jgi:hypothetical protein
MMAELRIYPLSPTKTQLEPADHYDPAARWARENARSVHARELSQARVVPREARIPDRWTRREPCLQRTSSIASGR